MDIDTSSYQHAAPPPQESPLAQIAGIQNIGLRQQQQQKNAIGIDKDKLDLVNQKWDLASKRLGGQLNNPDLSPSSLVDTYQELVKDGILTPEQGAKEMSSIQTMAGFKTKNPKATDQDYQNSLRQNLAGQLLKHASVIEQLNWFAGTQGPVIQTAQGQIPTVFNQRQGTVAPTGNYYPADNAPSLPTVNQSGQSQAYGQHSPNLPPQPGQKNAFPFPIQSPNNMGKGEPNNTGGRVDRGFGEIQQGQQQGKFSTGPMLGNAPGFEEGLKGKTEDQMKAKGLSIQNVTAIQAYKLLKGLNSGPTSGPWNEAVAAAKTLGIIPIDIKNDSTAIYQEVNKKLSKIIQAGGTRSDAELARSEESNPNVKTQINPALKKLIRDQIAQNRTSITMPNEFQGNDLSKYNAHASTYATKIDQDAATYDLLDPEEKAELWKKMKAKKDTAQGKRFFDTMRIMKRNKQYDQESLDRE